MIGWFLSHPRRRELAQLPLDERQQLRCSMLVARNGGVEQLRHFGRVAKSTRANCANHAKNAYLM
jgi:hypothetical protein